MLRLPRRSSSASFFLWRNSGIDRDLAITVQVCAQNVTSVRITPDQIVWKTSNPPAAAAMQPSKHQWCAFILRFLAASSF
mmetsp:Transcript_18851/g.21686  ORF Transcript_18851/g.21686 Transcript_18851/m.21686 type:complete len:80 (-) Transcript_18851:222-461(-)